MNAKTKAPQVEDAWEDRAVGAQEEHVDVAPDISAELDAALDLHPISIRLQRNLVENLKALAQLHGLGYQPLIRQILTRWVDGELKQMLAARANERSHNAGEDVAPARVPKERMRKAA